ncbi:tetratricopeptide repeat protein [Edaphobacter aggregans]|uniref:Tetratricopeptide repeat protein n=1 Tax=Edaphobacter aggregans TaxID=570835 RepID=A0A3R9QDM2_9BACT|nr:tetratricopeptide repeat protein [Edaphobacter aggregans]RSL19134.1 tetratricopeptide repeat protein [Edaphobacter aggregans]
MKGRHFQSGLGRFFCRCCAGLAASSFLLALVPGTLSGQDAPAIQSLRTGMQAMHDGRVDDAERAFRAAIAAAPQLPDAHMDLGLALLRKGRPAEAAASLSKAIEIDPAARGAHLFLGIAQYQNNHLDEARTALKQELAQNPKSTEALTWWGIVELAAGDPEAAILPLDEAAKLAPNDIDVLDYRARAHSLVANESYIRMREIDPESWHVHRALGQAFADMGNPQAAIKEYQAAIAKQPKNPDLYEALGNEYQKLSRFAEATQAYKTELQLSPDNPVALYNLGKIDVEQERAADGVAFLEKSVPLLQHPEPGYYYLGLGMVKLGRDSEAITWLEKSLRGNPSNFIKRGAYFQLARVYQRLHRPDDAARAQAELKKFETDPSGLSREDQ